MDGYSDPTAVYAALAGVYLTLFIFAIAVYVIGSIFMMKVFEKAGVQGKWRAWVPVYNQMIFLKLGDLSPWLILITIAASVIPFLNFFTGLASAVLLVMAAWRSRLRRSVSAPIISPAFSVAAFIEVMRAACSLVNASLSVMKTRLRR